MTDFTSGFNFDGANENEPGEFRFHRKQLSRVRDMALVLFDKFISANLSKDWPPAGPLTVTKYQRRFLSLAETKTIVLEHAVLKPNCYAISADNPEKGKEKVRSLMAALIMRVFSNVTQFAGEQGLVDVCFSSETNDFEFQITKQGKRIIKNVKEKVKNGADIDTAALLAWREVIGEGPKSTEDKDQ